MKLSKDSYTKASLALAGVFAWMWMRCRRRNLESDCYSGEYTKNYQMLLNAGVPEAAARAGADASAKKACEGK